MYLEWSSVSEFDSIFRSRSLANWFLTNLYHSRTLEITAVSTLRTMSPLVLHFRQCKICKHFNKEYLSFLFFSTNICLLHFYCKIKCITYQTSFVLKDLRSVHTLETFNFWRMLTTFYTIQKTIFPLFFLTHLNVWVFKNYPVRNIANKLLYIDILIKFVGCYSARTKFAAYK